MGSGPADSIAMMDQEDTRCRFLDNRRDRRRSLDCVQYVRAAIWSGSHIPSTTPGVVVSIALVRTLAYWMFAATVWTSAHEIGLVFWPPGTLSTI